MFLSTSLKLLHAISWCGLTASRWSSHEKNGRSRGEGRGSSPMMVHLRPGSCRDRTTDTVQRDHASSGWFVDDRSVRPRRHASPSPRTPMSLPHPVRNLFQKINPDTSAYKITLMPDIIQSAECTAINNTRMYNKHVVIIRNDRPCFRPAGLARAQIRINHARRSPSTRSAILEYNNNITVTIIVIIIVVLTH